ncbi:MAG TPA: hypothetical protein PLU17_09050 [Chitinophagaceae bacterium]|nr:hypothetical protein [Chitinophagaceae bacterium]
MKQHIKKWTIRLTFTALLIGAILLFIILNPILTYAHQTTYNNYIIYHNQPLDPTIKKQLNEVTHYLKKSEYYNPDLKLDICLNDGSYYPTLIKLLRGQAFAWGFYDKVVLQGTANFKKNYIELHGYKWNSTELLAHEMTHCLQFDKLGLWKSNPIANIPNWKWEGYAEYIARQVDDKKDLSKNIEHFVTSDENKWELIFADSTISPRTYFDNWNLVQYCIDIKKMTYQELVSDTTNEQTIRNEMMNWFESIK